MKIILLKSIPTVITVMVVAFFAHMIGYSKGHRDGLEKYVEKSREDSENSCGCGETRSCPFGGGVVGIQKCDNFHHRWLRCEPNTLYCDGVCQDLVKEAYNLALSKQADLLKTK
jgi:hypothetical protein